MATVRVDLDIPPGDYLRWYHEPRTVVNAVSRDGRRVQFPAGILRPYISHGGIRGSFDIRFDSGGRFQSIRRID